MECGSRGSDGPPLFPPLSPESRAALGAFCDSSAEPLETLLDVLLLALGAEFIVCSDPRGAPPGRTVGRRAPGRAIPRAERLLPPELAGLVLRERKPALKVEWAPSPRTWLIGCPLALNGEAPAVLVAGGPLPLPERLRGGPPEWLERWVPWVALARWSAELLRENRVLTQRLLESRAVEALLPAEGPSAPKWNRGAASAGDGPDPQFPEIVTASPLLREVLRTIALVAPSEAAVLIEGESGTGKELIARAIHRKSARAGGAFVTENCAACPEGLLESEFFGVEKGAFTGAHRTKTGLFERAHRGTLFLDEIGEMNLSLQSKLLRALEVREVRRVGGNEDIPVDFRLICATNRVLAEEAHAGRFRSDLLYRIDVLTIRLPPLRERPEDIPPLLTHFLAQHSRTACSTTPPVDPEALRLLCDYSWPGNVRELSNEMRRAVALRVPAVTPRILSAKILLENRQINALENDLLRPGRSLDQIEQDLLGGLIRHVMRKTGGNRTQAAHLLGIPKTGLYRRMRRYSIALPPFRRKPAEGGDEKKTR